MSSRQPAKVLARSDASPLYPDASLNRQLLAHYDIADSKRLRRVFKTCKNFGDHLQFSVFECDLSPMERVRMESELKELIHHGEDQVLFIALGPSESRAERFHWSP